MSPKAYSNTDTPEALAVNLFSCMVDPNKVKLDVNLRDKYPNTDGYMELVDDSGTPLGKLEVQIKKLPPSFNPNDPKIRISKSLLAYSKRTPNPVIYVGVNVSNRAIYWIHIHDNLINIKNEKLIDCKYKSTLIPLDLNNKDNGKIVHGNDDYIKSWQSISEKRLKSINEYYNLKKQFHELELHSEPSLGEYADEFAPIHVFLDELNDKFGYFDIIKNRFYFKDTWKLGIAYKTFTDNELLYTLYPIPFNKNDVQIKKISGNEEVLDGLGKIITHHIMSNPIKSGPKSYVKELISSEIFKILDYKLLKPCNEIIATEILLKVLEYSKNTISLEILKNYLKKEVANKNRTYANVVYESINYLESRNVKDLKSFYIPPDYEITPDTLWVWNRYSFESASTNLHTIFDNLPSVYNDILNCNFHKIRDYLQVFQGASKIIVLYSLKEEDKKVVGQPTFKMIYLKSSEPENVSFPVYDCNQLPAEIKDIYYGSSNEIEFEGKNYNVFKNTKHVLDFLFSDKPMQTFTYKLLRNDFDLFFKKWEFK